MIDSGSSAESDWSAWSGDDDRWALWMASAQQGDKHAYEQLLREVATAIERYLRVRFGPADFVDDITQECLLSIHRGRHTYDAKRPFRAWMFAIVRHRAIDHLRSRRRDSDASTDQFGIEEQPHPGSDSVTTLVDASLILSKLSREHRDIIVRTKYLGYNAHEVSRQLGISESAVRVRLHRAIIHTRRLFSERDRSPQ